MDGARAPRGARDRRDRAAAGVPAQRPTRRDAGLGRAAGTLRQYSVLVADEIAVATNNDSAYRGRACAASRRRHGDAGGREAKCAGHRRAGRGKELRVIPGSIVLRTIGHDGVQMVDIGPADAASARAATIRIPAGVVAVSGGSFARRASAQSGRAANCVGTKRALHFSPTTTIAGQSLAARWPVQNPSPTPSPPGMRPSVAAADALGRTVTATAPTAPPTPPPAPIRAYLVRPDQGRPPVGRILQNDVTVKDIELAARENYSSSNTSSATRRLAWQPTRAETSNVNGLATLAEATARISRRSARRRSALRIPLSRSARWPVCGTACCSTPWRRLPAHAEHVALGADMREYRGWIEPACYPPRGRVPAPGNPTRAAAARQASACSTDEPRQDRRGRAGARAYLNLLYYSEVAEPENRAACATVLLLRENPASSTTTA